MTALYDMQSGPDWSPQRRPLLLMGNGDARRRVAMLATDAGHRLVEAEAADPRAMLDRLDRQAAAHAVWVELDDDSEGLDDLAARINADVARGQYSAVVSAPAALLDPLAAILSDPQVQLLIDPDDLDRAAALAIAGTCLATDFRVQDVTAEPSSARLRQISDEVSRIAATLARLSSGPTTLSSEKPADPAAGPAAAISGDTVRSVIRARRLRGRYFEDELFADPAWDMMLDLLAAEIAQHRVPVSSLCIAAAVPATTALRWIKTMTDKGLFMRRADPHDGRRVFVELSASASRSMRGYFAEVGQAAVA